MLPSARDDHRVSTVDSMRVGLVTGSWTWAMHACDGLPRFRRAEATRCLKGKGCSRLLWTSSVVVTWMAQLANAQLWRQLHHWIRDRVHSCASVSLSANPRAARASTDCRSPTRLSLSVCVPAQDDWTVLFDAIDSADDPGLVVHHLNTSTDWSHVLYRVLRECGCVGSVCFSL